NAIRILAFSPDGKVLASACFDGTIKLWDPATGDEKAAWKGHPQAAGVVFSPDGQALATFDRASTSSGPGDLKLWAAAGNLKQTLQGHSGRVLSVAFSPDGKTLVTGGGENQKYGEICLWDLATGQLQVALRAHTSWIEAVAFSRDGKT